MTRLRATRVAEMKHHVVVESWRRTSSRRQGPASSSHTRRYGGGVGPRLDISADVVAEDLLMFNIPPTGYSSFDLRLRSEVRMGPHAPWGSEDADVTGAGLSPPAAAADLLQIREALPPSLRKASWRHAISASATGLSCILSTQTHLMEIPDIRGWFSKHARSDSASTAVDRKLLILS